MGPMRTSDNMASKIALIVVAVVAVVAVAAVAVVMMNNDDDDSSSSEPTSKILIEDQKGVYFWAEGSGETIADCLENLSDGVTATLVDSTYGKYLTAVNGLAGTADYSAYWSVYQYDNGKWTYSQSGLSDLKTTENPYIGLFYVISDTETYEVLEGGPDKVTVPNVEDAKVWNGSTKGTVFAIESETGLYFYINSNSGETMADRFAAATNAYKVPFESSKYGISSIFGIASAPKTDDSGAAIVDPETGYTVYNYWAQFGLVDGAWAYMETTLPNTTADDYKQMAIVYGDGGMGSASGPLPPVYKA